jgi:hypothetical protein
MENRKPWERSEWAKKVSGRKPQTPTIDPEKQKKIEAKHKLEYEKYQKDLERRRKEAEEKANNKSSTSCTHSQTSSSESSPMTVTLNLKENTSLLEVICPQCGASGKAKFQGNIVEEGKRRQLRCKKCGILFALAAVKILVEN